MGSAVDALVGLASDVYSDALYVRSSRFVASSHSRQMYRYVFPRNILIFTIIIV